MINQMDLYIVIFIILVSCLGFIARLLSFSGLIAASVVGYLVYLGFGVKGLLLLGIFFASSSFWSILFKGRKIQTLEKNEKSDRRDMSQVFANGIIPAISGALYFLNSSELWLYVFIASIATANSDTWASEIGSLSRRKPIHIFTFKKVDAGTSGAVSILGLFAAFSGAAIIGGIAIVAWEIISLPEAIILVLAGFIGNLVDTVLGASIQASFTCKICGIETEKTCHCNQNTLLTKGIKWFNNEVVNASSILVGALIASVVLVYVF